jgi:hypothetical protein
VCTDHEACSPRVTAYSERASTHAWVANVGLGVGLVGVAAGAYLIVLAPPKPSKPTSSARGDVVLVPGPGWVAVAGRF